MSENIIDIVKQYLMDNGYDGLYSDDCGCFVNDLAPCCGEDITHCSAGYLISMNDPEFGKCYERRARNQGRIHD